MMQSVFTRSSELASLERPRHEDAVLVLPYIDHALAVRLEAVLVRRALAPGLLVLVDDDERIGFMKIANFLFARSQSRHFGYLAQDAFPGDGWLRSALQTLDESGAGLLAFNDGRFFGTLAVFGLVRRSWAASLYHNCLFYPEYHSHFGDTEISAIAMHQGRLIFNPGCLMVEVDYEKHEKRNNAQDALLFKARAATGFGGLIAPMEA